MIAIEIYALYARRASGEWSFDRAYAEERLARSYADQIVADYPYWEYKIVKYVCASPSGDVA